MHGVMSEIGVVDERRATYTTLIFLLVSPSPIAHDADVWKMEAPTPSSLWLWQ